MHKKIVKNEKVILVPVQIEDAEALTEEINAAGSIKHLSYFEDRPTITVEEEREYLEKVIANENSYLFLIWPADGTPHLVGTIGLHEHDRCNDTIRPGIVIFPAFQGKGYGKAALHLLIEFAFLELNVNLIYLNVFPENKADKLYRSVGFNDEGILRERYKLRGIYHNMLSMSLTRSEWKKLNK